MNWYLQSGKESDVVFNSKVMLSRNINGFKFNLNNDDTIILENKIKELLFDIGYGLKFLKLKDMDSITKMSLIEKNLITPDFVLNKNEIGAILINDEENICIQINNNDHLEIQVFSSGFDLKSALNLAIEVEEKISSYLEFATSKKYGYLTTYPDNLGTGLRATVEMYLPGLSITKNTNKLFEIINKFGVEVNGMYGDKEEIQGNIYQLSNTKTIGLTEDEIIEDLASVVNKVIKQERQARKILTNNKIELEDKLYRSYGIFSNSRTITSKEALELLAYIKLGVDLGIITQINDLKVLELYLYTKPANLQKYLGENLDLYDRNIKRAEIIKQIIEAK